jgi:(1->4)-alpha-D-glucan 1-alpha-D-glucosylmutase
VEDTAFYRYSRLTSFSEVGADPSIFAIEPFDLHTKLVRRQLEQPLAMTALSTHDTKRSEDTRARISVLSEMAGEWSGKFAELDAAAPLGDVPFADLLWQAALGAWPFSRKRAHAYAEKAAREAGNSTSWLNPDEQFEQQLHAAVDAAFDNPEVNRILSTLAEETKLPGWTNSLSAKLVQLTMPGVPDVYQGTEFWDHSLVDPDNRRPVDFDARHKALARLGEGTVPAIDEGAQAKMLVVARALRLRRDRPDLFTGYEAVNAEGAAAEHVFGFDRGGAITLVTRLPLGLQRGGGWRDTAVVIPAGRYQDVLTGLVFSSAGSLPVGDVFAGLPVALLVKEEEQ